MESSIESSAEKSDDGVSLLILAINPLRFTDTLADRPTSPNSCERFPQRLEDVTKSGFRSPKTVGDFVVMLDALSVPGPLIMSEPLDAFHFLDEGAQFAVYRNQMLDDRNTRTAERRVHLHKVAVKKCKFILEDNQPMDVSVHASEAQIHDMQMEIAALQDPRLRKHPHIVDLLGWGMENNWHESPFLVLELAIGHLKHFLDGENNLVSWEIRQQLLLGVGAGLDAIHQCRIIHGDLKPENVLVFEGFSREVPFVAKLADFGISIDEVRANEDDLVRISGHSPGWSAPEVSAHFDQKSMMSTSQLLKGDNYSYGQLILSCMCFGGVVPFHSEDPTPVMLVQNTPDMPSLLKTTLVSALLQLLSLDSSQRPTLVGGLLRDTSECSRNWLADLDDYENSLTNDQMSNPISREWTLPTLGSFLFQGLEKSYHRYRTSITGQQAFAMFLLRSVYDVPQADKTIQISMLLESAKKGFVPAQDVAQRVLHSYDQEQSIPNDPEVIQTWLFNAASTGSFQAMAELAVTEPPLLHRAVDKFRGDLGYNQFYSPMVDASERWTSGDCINIMTNVESYQDANGNRALHYFAAHGNVEAVKMLLACSPTDINATNHRGETALYKACLVGCWKPVLELCRLRADASIPGSPNNATCLHWLFNFPTHHMAEVAKALLACGADPNAMVTMHRPSSTVPNYHFPFSWPPGSPLHWATAASSPEAVITLLSLGSNLYLRKGYDPYIADENVRQLDCHGTPEEGEFSEPSERCLGLNVIDLAASRHDWKLLECIRRQCRDGEFFTVDEEGYSPFHRLEYQRLGRTCRGSRFWFVAFMGNASTREKNVFETIRVLQFMNGDINQLTGSPNNPARMGVDGLTPLMLAVTKSDAESVAALLRCGTNPNVINRSGRSALMLLPETAAGQSPPGSVCAIVRCLLDHGADSKYQNLKAEMTPLASAIHSFSIYDTLSIDAVEMIIEAGADIYSTYRGLNVMANFMHYCAHQSNLGRPRISIKQSQQRARQVASIFKRSVIPRLSDVGLIVDRNNGTFLHYAVQAGLVLCVSDLLDAGAEINAVRTTHGHMPLASYGSIARSIPMGTPLDVVGAQIDWFTHKRGANYKQEDTDFIIGELEAIRRLLQEQGGKSAVELTNNVPAE